MKDPGHPLRRNKNDMVYPSFSAQTLAGRESHAARHSYLLLGECSTSPGSNMPSTLNWSSTTTTPSTVPGAADNNAGRNRARHSWPAWPRAQRDCGESIGERKLPPITSLKVGSAGYSVRFKILREDRDDTWLSIDERGAKFLLDHL